MHLLSLWLIFFFVYITDNVCSDEDDLHICKQKTISFLAISDLHSQLDGDRNGGVDFEEASKFLKNKLSSSVDHRRQQTLSQNDDIISLPDLWLAWKKNPAYNWTTKDTIRWLTDIVELPQYEHIFLAEHLNGTNLPRLVMRNMTYVNDVLKIKNPFHKRKLSLKAMDLILFGSPKKIVATYNELSVLAALVVGLFLIGFACLNCHYTRKLKWRDSAAQDGLYKAEQTLRELQQKLKEVDPVSYSGHRTMCIDEDDSGRSSDQGPSVNSSMCTKPSAFSNEHRKPSYQLSSHNLRFGSLSTQEPSYPERKMLSNSRYSHSSKSFPTKTSFDTELILPKNDSQRMFKHLDSINANQNELTFWLQVTHEQELKHYFEKRSAAARQLLAAKDACDRVRRKRNSLMGSIRLIHSDNLDDVEFQLDCAKRVLASVSKDLQERILRWSRIEDLTGLCIQKHFSENRISMTENKRAFFSSCGSSLVDLPADFQSFSENKDNWYPNISQTHLNLVKTDKPNLQSKRLFHQFDSSFDGSSPESFEFGFQSKGQKSYSSIRPFATFWRRKVRSKKDNKSELFESNKNAGI